MATAAIPRPAPKATILIVEDEGIIAEDLRDYLQTLGYEVVPPARCAAEAIRTLERRQIDLVLMDISLHGRMEGIEATVEIEDRFGIPVIYLSGCTWPEIEPSVICSQPFGFVGKPYEGDYLAHLVSRALQGPGAMAGA